MKAILVSNLGTSVKIGGRRIPAPILEANGLQEKLKIHLAGGGESVVDFCIPGCV